MTTLTGHEDLIEYMCSFRTAYYPENKRKIAQNRLRVYVRGILCWFQCNKYGEVLENQYPIFITRVPVKHRKPEKGRERMEAIRNRKRKLNQILTDEPGAISPDAFNVKRKMPETITGRRKENDEDERERTDYSEQWGQIGF